MFKRYLFGPVTAEFARQNLHEERAGGRCVCFGSEPGLDAQVGPRDTWEDTLTQLGDHRRPDLLVLHLQYNAIPADLWAAPVPIVALAGDWSLQYHAYRRLLRHADLVLTDTAGVEAFTRDGIANARSANLFGLPSELASAEIPAGERDIDVLFVGNFHPAVHSERLPWVGRLAQLSKRWNVVLQAGVIGPESS